MNTKEIKNAIGKTVGCKFATLTYTAKKTGEMARHTILLGASLENAYKKDLESLKAYEPKNDIEKEALSEMVASIENSLAKGIGNNDSYTQKGVWLGDSKNIRQSVEGNKMQVMGMSVGKIVIKEGIRKEVKSRPKTIAKKSIRKKLNLRTKRIRAFSIEGETLQRMAANGETLEIQ